MNKLAAWDVELHLNGEMRHPDQAELEAFKQKQIEQLEGKYHSQLGLALDDLKRGESSIAQQLRDEVLVATWAKETGADLEQMNQTASAFARQWRDANASVSFDDESRLKSNLAGVKFGIRFSIGITFYCTDVEIQILATPGEAEEFHRLNGVGEIKAKDKLEWHTPDFRSVWICGQRGKRKDYSLTNEFRAICLLLDERPGKNGQYGELEAKIGTRTHELDVADGHGPKSSQPGPRRLREMLETQQGELLQKLGILKVEGVVGREKFLRLCPPKQGQ